MKTSNACDSQLNFSLMQRMFKEKCKGLKECVIDNFKQFLSDSNKNKVSKQCALPSSRIFIQYMCTQTPQELSDKASLMSYNIHIEILGGILTLLAVIYSRWKVSEVAETYDERTITPSDYALYFYVDKGQVDTFNKIFHDNTDPASRGAQFRTWIRHQIQVFNQKNKHVKVLRTDLVFDNRELIKLLVKRGEAIKFSQQDKVFKTEYEIKQLL
jgi:hypothetical protein